MQSEVERVLDPPDERLQERGPPARDLVEVAARLARCGARGSGATPARPRARGCRRAAPSFSAKRSASGVQLRLEVEVRDLGQRVHARVGAAGAVQLGRGAVRDLAGRRQDLARHRARVLLDLPAGVARALVLDRQLEAHGRPHASTSRARGGRILARVRDGLLRRAVKRVARARLRVRPGAHPAPAPGARRAALRARRRVPALRALLRGARPSRWAAPCSRCARCTGRSCGGSASSTGSSWSRHGRASACSSSAARTSTPSRAPATATTRGPACAATTRGRCSGSRCPEMLPGCGYKPVHARAASLARALEAQPLTDEQRAKLAKGLFLDG